MKSLSSETFRSLFWEAPIDSLVGHAFNPGPSPGQIVDSDPLAPGHNWFFPRYPMLALAGKDGREKSMDQNTTGFSHSYMVSEK